MNSDLDIYIKDQNTKYFNIERQYAIAIDIDKNIGPYKQLNLLRCGNLQHQLT